MSWDGVDTGGNGTGKLGGGQSEPDVSGRAEYTPAATRVGVDAPSRRSSEISSPVQSSVNRDVRSVGFTANCTANPQPNYGDTNTLWNGKPRPQS